jgi:hypothetical protein
LVRVTSPPSAEVNLLANERGVPTATPLTAATDEKQEWRGSLTSLSRSRETSTEPGDH